MNLFPKKLKQKLDKRKTKNALRKLGSYNNLSDFSSNDYLGFAKYKDLFNKAHDILNTERIFLNGATGSRLLSGNHKLYDKVEFTLCEFHNSDTALVFNSGYDANIGLFSSIPQRRDVILYDELVHASIRDGIIMSNAKSYKFKHNNLKDLEKLLKRISQNSIAAQQYKSEIYIATESVFSMDGDSPNIKTLCQLSQTHNAHLIIDEAHALGVFKRGLVQELALENKVFARIITFGKALGCHGAVILGSQDLKDYLINFSRPFIYTTGLPPHSLATIHSAYNELQQTQNISRLHQNIQHFKSELKRLKINTLFIYSNSAIHCCIISGNKNVKTIAQKLQNNGFEVKPILSPTVPQGQERLRFCLHSYNSSDEITKVLELLTTFV